MLKIFTYRLVNRVSKSLLILLVALVSFQCASNKSAADDLDGRDNYDKGLKMLEKKRYLRAQEELNQAVISGAHTEWGEDAAFYLAEAYFLNEEFLLSIAEYERIIRRMPFTKHLEKIRYRICESYVAMSPIYYHDQLYTEKAIDELQGFLDDFPESEFREEALEANRDLRAKLGKKAYETGILYIKMDEPVPAIMAFEEVINNYYDTDYVDESHLEILHAHCLNLDLDTAREYMSEHPNVFSSDSARSKAEEYMRTAQKILDKRDK